MAYEPIPEKKLLAQYQSERPLHLSDRGFLIFIAATFGSITLLVIVFLCVFLQNLLSQGDTNIFYIMVDVILSGRTPYVDFHDVKPPLIFFILAVPAALGFKIPGSIILVGACNMASAMIVAVTGWKLYGRLPGLVAGLLFMVNMALAQGYCILTEPFTLVFVLLSAYVLLFLESDRKYLAAGVFAGIAIGFKQYALLTIPLSLFLLYRKGEIRGTAPFILGVLLPLIVVFGAIFLVYGVDAGGQSLYWSFGVADTYMTSNHVQDVGLFPASSPELGLVELVFECSLFVSLLVLGTASFLIDRPVTVNEEFFFLSALAFIAMLGIRQYLHYWAFVMPFVILLCVRIYREHGRAPGISGQKSNEQNGAEGESAGA